MENKMNEKALGFATQAHGEQKYGEEPYSVHLSEVAKILQDFDYGAMLPQGYLHDVLEDTPVPLSVLVEEFGEEIAQDVWAVTGVGPNRKARNASIYQKLAARPRAVPIKLADRLANVRHMGDDRLLQMYRKEYPEFRAAMIAADPELSNKKCGEMLTELDVLMVDPAGG